ncbi:MAG: FHA domain-containing protein [Methylacidiphilales bacterium]|nr:FHA domain-containing protein [Candidatus Methylacidiphilales bacterium]
MSFYQLLASFTEAFVRLAQTRERGCLLVFNAQEAIHLFVDNGMIVHAAAGKVEGEEALTRAFELKGSSYGWIPGAEPAKKDLEIDMREYLHKHSIGLDQRFGKTIRMTLPNDRKEKKLETHYYFIPEESPTFKLKVKKVTNVVGREGTCDVYVESNQVSRRHCLLQVTERGLLVKDLESTNGTFVNGMPMSDGYINEGDRLSLGTYVMTLHREKT